MKRNTKESNSYLDLRAMKWEMEDITQETS